MNTLWLQSGTGGGRDPARGPMVGRMVRLVGMIWGVLGLVVMAGQSAQPGAVGASAPAQNVAVISIRGPIDSVTAESVDRRMTLAEKGGADAVVLEIDTPGGEVPAVLEICQRIKTSSVSNIVAWIHDDAYSGGAIIALACGEIIVSRYASMGDAAPIAFNPVVGVQPLPETERSKLLSPIMAEIVDSARRNGYDEKLVQGMVSLGVELWLVERVSGEEGGPRRLFISEDEYRVLFGSAPDRTGGPAIVSGAAAPAPPVAPEGPPDPTQPTASPDDPARFIPASPELGAIADQVTFGLSTPSARPVLTPAEKGKWRLVRYVADGRTLIVLKTDQMREYGLARAVVADDTDLAAYFGAANVRRLDPAFTEGLASELSFLTLPIVRFVLLFTFLVSLFLVLAHPGLVLPESVAAAALVALLAPPLLVGLANWWEIAAVAAGILLVALEIFVIPGFGVAGVCGLLLLLGGLLGTFVRESSGSLFPNSPEQRSDLFYGLVTIVMAFATSGVALYYISRHFGAIPILERLVLKNGGAAEDEGGDAMLAAMGAGERPLVREGTVGVALTPLRPAGRAQVGDRIIDVVAELGYIEEGAAVRVVRADAFRVAVEPADDAAPGSPAAGGAPA